MFLNSNIQGSIVKDGNEYVINARKWWTSGAMDPRCKIIIFLGKADPIAENLSLTFFGVVLNSQIELDVVPIK